MADLNKGETIRQAIERYNKLSKEEQKIMNEKLSKANTKKWDNFRAIARGEGFKALPEAQQVEKIVKVAGSNKNIDNFTKAISKAMRFVGRRALGPVGVAAALFDPSSANIGEDKLLYETRRKKVPGGGPDLSEHKRTFTELQKYRKNYSKGGGVRSANY